MICSVEATPVSVPALRPCSWAHGTGFGVLTSASLTGMAISPFFAGLAGGTSIRIVFLVDFAIMGACAVAVRRTMEEHASGFR